MRRRHAHVLIAAAVCLVALVGAGCGSTTNDSASGSGDASTGSSSQGLEKAKELVSAAKKPMKLTLPTSPVDMSKLAGKTIWVILPSLQIPYVQSQAASYKAAAAASGLKVKLFDGQGNVSLFNQGVATAVSQKASGIVLQGVSPDLVKGPLAQAKAAGIPVVDVFNRGPDTPLPATVSGQVTRDYAAAGRLMADFVTADSGGHADLVVLTWGIYTIYQQMVPAFQAELKTVCPQCKIEAVDSVSPAAPEPELQSTVSTLLRRFPNVKYVVPVSDSLAIEMVSTVAAVPGVKIVSADGIPQSFAMIRGNGPEVASVAGPPVETIGWSVLDQMARILLKQPLSPEDTSLPQQLFVKANLGSANPYPEFSNYQQKYKELWGRAGK
jgi:ribose transport system substrate-binding protein